MAMLDWSRRPAVGSIPGKVGGAWVFRGARLPVSVSPNGCGGRDPVSARPGQNGCV
jgi:hypothetical protein